MHLKRVSFKAKLQKAAQVSPLTFVQYGGVDSNILNFETEAISSITPLIKAQIHNLKQFASENRFIGLSAIQGGYPDRVFIVSKEVKSVATAINSSPQSQQLTSTWLTHQQFPIDSFTAYINPRIIKIGQNGERDVMKEISWSFPMLEAAVPRYKSIRVQYFNENMDEQEVDLVDFESRTFQHFLDFNMNKHFLNWRVCQDSVAIAQLHQDKFKRFAAALEDYKREVNKMREEIPERFLPRSLSELNKANEHLAMASFEVDMGRTLLKNIRKDMNIDVTQLELDQMMGV